MSKNGIIANKAIDTSPAKRLDGGYQPLIGGYQPREKRGYTPASGSASNPPPKPPKGGTGQSSGKS
jgi:hypothetical protein